MWIKMRLHQQKKSSSAIAAPGTSKAAAPTHVSRSSRGSAVSQAFLKLSLSLTLLAVFVPWSAGAGVFQTPHFLMKGKSSLGVEPDLYFDPEPTLGMNVRYQRGVNDTNNFFALLGVGNSPRMFRLGAGVTFDLFPDHDTQPGVGLALQGEVIQLPLFGQYNLSVIPYIHKNLKQFHAPELEPFLALPVGLALLSNGTYQNILVLAMGSRFQHNEAISSVLELGIGIFGTSTSVSGGASYSF